MHVMTKHDRMLMQHRTQEPQKNYHPIDVYRRLLISPATLRRWSTDFARYLSQGASRSQSDYHAQRRYTAHDIDVLTTIKRLRNAGFSTAGIEDQLREQRS